MITPLWVVGGGGGFCFSGPYVPIFIIIGCMLYKILFSIFFLMKSVFDLNVALCGFYINICICFVGYYIIVMVSFWKLSMD